MSPEEGHAVQDAKSEPGKEQGRAGAQQYQVVSAYDSAYPDPILIQAGEELVIGEKESKWPGWLWCTTREGKSGWVPGAYVERRDDGCRALRIRPECVAVVAVKCLQVVLQVGNFG